MRSGRALPALATALGALAAVGKPDGGSRVRGVDPADRRTRIEFLAEPTLIGTRFLTP